MHRVSVRSLHHREADQWSVTSAAVSAIATKLTLRTFEFGVSGGALAPIRSVGIF